MRKRHKKSYSSKNIQFVLMICTKNKRKIINEKQSTQKEETLLLLEWRVDMGSMKTVTVIMNTFTSAFELHTAFCTLHDALS